MSANCDKSNRSPPVGENDDDSPSTGEEPSSLSPARAGLFDESHLEGEGANREENNGVDSGGDITVLDDNMSLSTFLAEGHTDVSHTRRVTFTSDYVCLFASFSHLSKRTHQG